MQRHPEAGHHCFQWRHIQGQRALVQRGDFFTDAQAQSHAIDLSIARLVAAVEAIKGLFFQVGGDVFGRIFYRQLQHFPIAMQVEFDPAFFLVVLEGVAV